MINNKIISIQLLRAIACLLVLQLHFIPNIPFTNNIFFGAIGVDIFFIISGYIIASSICNIEGEKKGIRFLINRFARVVPYYWILTLCGLIFVFVFSKNHSLELIRFLKSLLFIPQEDPTLPMGWTLNHEIYFYAIIGISAFFLPRLEPLYYGLIFLALLLISQLLPNINYTVLFLKSSINYTFLLGFFSYFYKDKITIYFQNKFAVTTSIIIFILITAISCDFAMFNHQQDWFTFSAYKRDIIFIQSNAVTIGFPRFIIWGLPSFLLFLVILSKEEFLKRLSNSLIIKIGDASYTVYLLQFFIITIVLHFKPTNFVLPVIGAVITIFLSLYFSRLEAKIGKTTRKTFMNLIN